MPKNKKNAETSSSDSDSGPDDRNVPPTKKVKEDNQPKAATSGGGSSAGNGGGGGDGTTTWTLEKLRRVRINEFRGRKMVDIREFYEKNGEILPGKKGISLSALQWKKLIEYTDEITRALGD